MRTPASLAAAALVALSLTACTSTSEPPRTDTAAGAPSTQAATQAPAASPTADTGKTALEAAVRKYSTAYLSGHGTTAYALLSKRCKTRITKAALTTLASGAAEVYGNVEIKTLTVDQLSGNLARVSYTYPVTKLNQAGQPWTREGGAWHYDAC